MKRKSISDSQSLEKIWD